MGGFLCSAHPNKQLKTINPLTILARKLQQKLNSHPKIFKKKKKRNPILNQPSDKTKQPWTLDFKRIPPKNPESNHGKVMKVIIAVEYIRKTHNPKMGTSRIHRNIIGGTIRVSHEGF